MPYNRSLLRKRVRFNWPPYSPDLNPLDFYLWGYLKSKVYSNPYPDTVEQLKKNIIRECKKINLDTIKSAIRNFSARMQYSSMYYQKRTLD